jgi:hypothetical protein
VSQVSRVSQGVAGRVVKLAFQTPSFQPIEIAKDNWVRFAKTGLFQQSIDVLFNNSIYR